MFKKTTIRLTGFYLAILMAISIAFSLVIYQVSLNELNRGLRRPFGIGAEIRPGDSTYDTPTTFFIQDFQQQQSEVYYEARDRLIDRLVFTNLIILLGGGVMCYFLARRTLQPIEESHAALERFTSDASHELRTPLAVMQSENEVTLMDPKLTLKDAKAQISSNLEEVAKLTALTEGLLRLSRHDGQELQKEKVNVNEVVGKAAARFEKPAQQKDIKLTMNLPKASLEVLGDEDSLVQSVAVLIDNAIKYSPTGSKVSVKLEAQAKKAIIVVKDNGPGIDAADLPHVFERFYRSDSSRTKIETQHGYGLGLAIARNIVESHDGQITVVSNPGKGSTFSIILPVSQLSGSIS